LPGVENKGARTSTRSEQIGGGSRGAQLPGGPDSSAEHEAAEMKHADAVPPKGGSNKVPNIERSSPR